MMKGLALSICKLQSAAGTSGENPSLAAALVTPGLFLLSRSASFQRFD